MITLHTYGDSHATHFGGWDGVTIDTIRISTNHLIGKLAYSFGRDKIQVVKGVNENDIILFCFGEIDCRCHINKYEPDWKLSIDNLIDTYFDTIKLNVSKFKNLKTCVYNVVPPLERENPLNLWTEVWANNHGVPATGSDEERKKYTEYMNNKLSEKCIEFGYTFFDVYSEYSDENGFLKRELSDTNCHIKDQTYIKEFIIKNLI